MVHGIRFTRTEIIVHWLSLCTLGQVDSYMSLFTDSLILVLALIWFAGQCRVTWPPSRKQLPFFWISPLHSPVLKPYLHLKIWRKNRDILYLKLKHWYFWNDYRRIITSLYWMSILNKGGRFFNTFQECLSQNNNVIIINVNFLPSHYYRWYKRHSNKENKV